MVVPTAATVLNGGKNGIGLMRRYPFITTIGTLFTVVSSFYIWHRIVGYNNLAITEQQYAKEIKMLRNLLIKQ